MPVAGNGICGLKVKKKKKKERKEKKRKEKKRKEKAMLPIVSTKSTSNMITILSVRQVGAKSENLGLTDYLHVMQFLKHSVN